jgi:heat shock protein HtpX
MFESLGCYFSCLWNSNAGFIIIGLLIILFAAMIVFFFTLRPGSIYLAQGMTTSVIIVGFLGMNCPMISYIWIYFGIILFGILALLMLHMAFRWRLSKLLAPPGTDLSMLKRYSRIYTCKIRLLDMQKPQAFTYRNQVYLSIGLLEMLEPWELEAVIAHESYHVLHSPNRFVTGMLAISSFWFYMLRNEKAADRYASDLVGRNAVASALRKLDIKDYQQRVSALSR